MLSSFCVVCVITWNVSVGFGATGPGAAAFEPQDASAPASMNATAASPHVPRTRLMRWSPRALCFDLMAAWGPRPGIRPSRPPGLKGRLGLGALDQAEHMALRISEAGNLGLGGCPSVLG